MEYMIRCARVEHKNYGRLKIGEICTWRESVKTGHHVSVNIQTYVNGSGKKQMPTVQKQHLLIALPALLISYCRRNLRLIAFDIEDKAFFTIIMEYWTKRIVLCYQEQFLSLAPIYYVDAIGDSGRFSLEQKLCFNTRFSNFQCRNMRTRKNYSIAWININKKYYFSCCTIFFLHSHPEMIAFEPNRNLHSYRRHDQVQACQMQTPKGCHQLILGCVKLHESFDLSSLFSKLDYQNRLFHMVLSFVNKIIFRLVIISNQPRCMFENV